MNIILAIFILEQLINQLKSHKLLMYVKKLAKELAHLNDQFAI